MGNVRDDLSPRRRQAALLALALGGFGIGLAEFAPMGLLPQIAQGLRPRLWAHSHSQAITAAGWMITVYALGVMVGAPAIAILAARVSRTLLAISLLVSFAVGSLASAMAPSFGLELAARFLAGLPHGAYFGVAGSAAATLIGPGGRARGYAVVLSGLTAANVVGTPLVAGLGQVTTWRVAFLVIAGVFGLAVAAVWSLVPSLPASGGSPRAELSAFRSRRMWFVAATVAVGFAGFFAVYTYIAPVTTHLAGLSTSAVPWVLATAGLGMSVGVAFGGHAADRSPRRALISGQACVVAAIALFAVIARNPVGLFVGVFLVGATALFTAPAIQSRLIDVAPGAELMGAAVNQSASNLANSLGAALGGVAISVGFGYSGPAIIAVVVGALGLVLFSLSFRMGDRSPVEGELVSA